MSDEVVELYRKHRPETFGAVVGQDAAIQALFEMGKRGLIPHFLLFTGPSGTGKTTLARILVKKLNCTDFIEVNAASSRGIDMVRDIERLMRVGPLGGGSRVWLIDEMHMLTAEAQNGFLKILEDTPKHVYFMGATTDPQKLKKTIITRATVVQCKPVADEKLVELINSVAEKEQKALNTEVAKKIAEVAEGSARKALVILHQVIGISDQQKQMSAIESVDSRIPAFEICRALLGNRGWAEVSKILRDNEDQDAEGMRRMILSYARKVLLGNGNHKRAAMIIEEFRDHFYDCGDAGLAVCCFNLCG